MNSDQNAENNEAIALGLEPPHYTETGLYTETDGTLMVQYAVPVTDAHRMSALRNAREA